MSSDSHWVWIDRGLGVAFKPAGMPSQRTADGTEGLYEILRATEPYVGLHHRLDRNASGLLLFTLDPALNPHVSRAFREHRIQRDYRVAVAGWVDDDTWEWPVGGKTAKTIVRCIERRGGLSILDVELETGRKHQIRVHAAMNGSPVVGDRTYGGDTAPAHTRLALHAGRLTLDHPAGGPPIVLERPVDDDWLPGRAQS